MELNVSNSAGLSFRHPSILLRLPPHPPQHIDSLSTSWVCIQCPPIDHFLNTTVHCVFVAWTPFPESSTSEISPLLKSDTLLRNGSISNRRRFIDSRRFRMEAQTWLRYKDETTKQRKHPFTDPPPPTTYNKYVWRKWWWMAGHRFSACRIRVIPTEEDPVVRLWIHTVIHPPIRGWKWVM